MPDLVNELTSHTGISPELVRKGLGALLSFLKKELGEETFDKLSNSIPEAPALTSHYESAPEPPEGVQPQGGFFEIVSGLAGKLLGGKAGEGADLLSLFLGRRFAKPGIAAPTGL